MVNVKAIFKEFLTGSRFKFFFVENGRPHIMDPNIRRQGQSVAPQ
jgi:hypothetical protein